MIQEAHIYEELSNIVLNQPLFPGDTISHRGADECVRRGWASRSNKGDFFATASGSDALALWLEGE